MTTVELGIAKGKLCADWGTVDSGSRQEWISSTKALVKRVSRKQRLSSTVVLIIMVVSFAVAIDNCSGRIGEVS